MMVFLSCLAHGAAAGVFYMKSGVPIETPTPVGREVLWVESVSLPGEVTPTRSKSITRVTGKPDPVRSEPLDQAVEARPFEVSPSEVSPAGTAPEGDHPNPVSGGEEEEGDRADGGDAGGPQENPGDEQKALLQDFLRQVRNEIERVRDYPYLALWGHIEGRVLVRFDIATDGHARKVQLVHSSGSALLDRTALLTIEKIRRFPPVPPGLGFPEVSLTVPLVYQIDGSEK
jgi:TonB family protein